MTQLSLWVDNEDSTGAWTTTGTAPYIDAQDQPTNYIHDTGRNNVSGTYSFETTTETGTINFVRLYIYAYGVTTSDFEAYLGASATGLGPPTSWGWVYVDVSSILDTWTAINAATVHFDRPNTPNDAGVDACYILVDYTESGGGDVNFAAVINGVTTTPTVNLDKNPEFAAAIAGVTTTPTANLDKNPEFAAAIAGITTTPTANLDKNPEFAAAITGIATTPDDVQLDIGGAGVHLIAMPLFRMRRSYVA